MGTHRSAPEGGGESLNETISARLGIAAVYCPLIGTTERMGSAPIIRICMHGGLRSHARLAARNGGSRVR
jgi:hypothetical protein